MVQHPADAWQAAKAGRAVNHPRLHSSALRLERRTRQVALLCEASRLMWLRSLKAAGQTHAAARCHAWRRVDGRPWIDPTQRPIWLLDKAGRAPKARGRQHRPRSCLGGMGELATANLMRHVHLHKSCGSAELLLQAVDGVHGCQRRGHGAAACAVRRPRLPALAHLQC